MSRTTLLGPDTSFLKRLAPVRHAPATLVFLACCVVMFLAAEWHGSTLETPTLVRFGATERGRIWSGEVWRLVTAAFLHIGFWHLFWNVYALIGWCVPVERALGSRRFAALYLGTAVAASATSVAAHDVVGAGASGAGFGVVGATLILEAHRLGSWKAFRADPGVRRRLASIAIWIAILAVIHVDHAAHAGGFVSGLAIAWALVSGPDAAAVSARWTAASSQAPEGAAPAAAAVPAPPDAPPLPDPYAAPGSEPRGTHPAGAGTRGTRGPPGISDRRAYVLALASVVLPVAVALVPHPGLTSYARLELAVALFEAIEHHDLPEADRLLARADGAGVDSPWVAYGRARLHEQHGELDAAASVYEALARSPDPDWQKRGANGGKVLLARRLELGLGMARDPVRARALLEEVCASGDDDVCAWLGAHPPGGNVRPKPGATGR